MGCLQSAQITEEIADKIIKYLQKNPKNACIVDFPHFDEELSLLNAKIVKCDDYYQILYGEEKLAKQDEESLKILLVTGKLKDPIIREIDVELGFIAIDEKSIKEKIRKPLKI